MFSSSVQWTTRRQRRLAPRRALQRSAAREPACRATGAAQREERVRRVRRPLCDRRQAGRLLERSGGHAPTRRRRRRAIAGLR